MKRTFVFLVIVLISLSAKAQDIITLIDGTKIQASVLEINPESIRYKEFSNLEGPVIVIRRETVATISYPNGHVTVIDDGNKSSGSHKKITGKSGGFLGLYFAMSVPAGVSNTTSAGANYSTSNWLYLGEVCTITRMLDEHLGTQFGFALDYYSYGVKYNSPSPIDVSNDNMLLNYFTLPIRTLYFSNSKSRLGVYGSIGAELSFLIDASSLEIKNLVAYYKPVTMNLYFSCGVEFRNKNANTIWMIGPYYKTTGNNIYSGISEAGLSPGNVGQLYSAGLSVTYMNRPAIRRR